MQEMQVVVLMGGLGTRLGPQASGIPKAMVEVHGKPFFWYQLDLLKCQGVREFVFCVNYAGQAIRDYFGDGSRFGVSIRYSEDGPQPLGTGGALRKTLPLLKNDFLVIYGDSYGDIDYFELLYAYIKRKRKRNIRGLMALFKNQDQLDSSNVVFKEDRLLNYDKKNRVPGMDYIDYGAVFLEKDALAQEPEEAWDLSDWYHRLSQQGKLAGYEVYNRFYEIGKPESLAEFKEFIAERRWLQKSTLFLDRDGTLNSVVSHPGIEGQDSPFSANELELLPTTAEALSRLRRLGYRLIVVTNQPAAAKGKTDLEKLFQINHRLKKILEEKEVLLDALFLCPHHPEGSPQSADSFLIQPCACRKPGPGLLEKGAGIFGIDKENSYMIGDSWRDIGAGKAFGVKTVFLGNPEIGSRKNEDEPDLFFNHLLEFAVYLEKQERSS